MSFISQDPSGRYRRRAAETRRRVLVNLLVFGAIAATAYWGGRESMRSSETSYRQQAENAQQEKETLEKKVTTLQSTVQSTEVRYQQLEAQYKQDAPAGKFKELTDAVKKQLDAGASPERLQRLIQSLRPPKNCTPPTSKRFVMQTPVYKGPQGSVSFGNGTVTVSGEGAPAVNQDGRAEAWFDPGKPVTIVFTRAGGEPVTKKGLLPVEYTTAVGDKEYRFTVAAGERSFINVTSDTCDLQ